MLAAHGPSLPQPDQLCGPFSARVALHAVLADTEVPDVLVLAAAAGSTIWPYDVAALRPAGAPLERAGWDELPPAPSLDSAGTDAAGLVAGLRATLGDRAGVVPVPGAELSAYRLGVLLREIARAPHPLGVVAHLRTGPIAPPGRVWDVGHFVMLCALDSELDQVLVGDTYAELTATGMPHGCRRVSVAALAEALAAPPGRGLLILTRAGDRDATSALVAASGPTGIWST